MKQNIRLANVNMTGRVAFTPALLSDQKNHRVSFVILLLYIVFVMSIDKYDVTAGIIYAVFPALLITAGRLPMGIIVKRLTLLSPFILIMAAANPFLDTKPYIRFGDVVVSSGWVSGIVIIIKSIVSISAVLAFSLCVPFNRICDVLRDFRVPDVFVTQLVLLYRYSFLLVEEAMAMQKARNLKSFGKKGRDIFTTSKLIGSLLLRTNSKAGRIYRGMIARGFNGELTRKKSDVVRPAEVIMVLFAMLIFSVIRVIF